MSTPAQKIQMKKSPRAQWRSLPTYTPIFKDKENMKFFIDDLKERGWLNELGDGFTTPFTPFTYLISQGHYDLAKELLKVEGLIPNAGIQENSDEIHNPLARFVDDGDKEWVITLVEKGMDVNAKVWRMGRIITIAAKQKDEDSDDIFEFLLNHGVDLNLRIYKNGDLFAYLAKRRDHLQSKIDILRKFLFQNKDTVGLQKLDDALSQFPHGRSDLDDDSDCESDFEKDDDEPPAKRACTEG
jgi:hypothetical protein